MTQLVVSVLLVLFFSALASGTEAALFSVPYGKVMSAVELKRRGATSLKQLKDDFRRPITTIVIVNNLSNILGSIAVGALASDLFDAKFIGLFSGALTFLVIVYAEIIPKTFGERHCESIALSVARPLLVLTKILSPVHLAIEVLVKPFAGEAVTATASEEEIRALTKLGEAQGVIDEEENILIQKVFHLDDVSARDIMTPISAADTIQANQQIGDLREWLVGLTHSRIPVYANSIDNIVGIAHIRDLLLALAEGREGVRVSEISQEADFVPMSVTTIDLLNHFKRTKTHLAMVVNAEGTVLGLVTLEDAIEELIGEIEDETDLIPTAEIEQLSADEMIADANVEISEVNALWGTTTVGGRLGEFVIAEIGRIPVVAEVFEFGEFDVIIVEATPRKISRVRLVRKNVGACKV
jgi:CBS domain containing-hemolysin-like protein